MVECGIDVKRCVPQREGERESEREEEGKS